MISESDFIAAGYSAKFYSDLKYIAHDEEVHVQAISAVLTAAGVTPNKACEYMFPMTDVC
jgi:organic hydroperoxide reductase OsmC/OhrA